MKAIILAAGMVMRIESPLPKCLTHLTAEKTILDFQIERLSAAFSPDQIVVVVGYKYQLIMERHPQLMYVYNHDYVSNGTAKSLLCALRKFHGEDVLWLNGDIYFDEGVLDLLIGDHKFSSCLVDHKKCGAEEVKYDLDAHGFISHISKEVSPAKGEALGINIVRKNELPLFQSALTKCKMKDYFEKAIENLAVEKKLKMKPVDKGNLFCQEIDFQEDLDAVQRYLTQK